MGASVAGQGEKIRLIDYISLTKPRTIIPHFITAASAMFLAVGGMPAASLVFFTLAGGGMIAAAANVVNCYFDRDIDKLMLRTQYRPLPDNRIKPGNSLVFGVILGLLGLGLLEMTVNSLATTLALTAAVYYIVIYTLLLKRRTYWSTIIGSGIGAITPLVGWAAVTNTIMPTALILSVIILLWTFPHFWSLAIYRYREYEEAGVRIPPSKQAARWIVLCSLVLVILVFILVAVAGLSPLYLLITLALGIILLGLAIHLEATHSRNVAHRLYRYSVVYVVIVFSAVIVDSIIF